MGKERDIAHDRHQPLLLGFPDYREAAMRLAAQTGLAYADIETHAFPDGESLVRLPVGLPPRVVLYTSLDRANQRLVELELAAATAASLGATWLGLVAPYLCYMRQDKPFEPGQAVSQRVIGQWLARRFDLLMTVDPHLHRTHRLEDAVPVDRAVALSAAAPLADWVAGHIADPLLIGPDEESEQWLSAMAEPRALEFAVACKRRLGDREVEISLPEVDISGRNAVLVDDVASSGHTLAEAARLLRERDAASITVAVTHALFVGEAFERVRAAGVEEVCSTDSVTHSSNRVQLAGLLSGPLVEALKAPPQGDSR